MDVSAIGCGWPRCVMLARSIWVCPSLHVVSSMRNMFLRISDTLQVSAAVQCSESCPHRQWPWPASHGALQPTSQAHLLHFASTLRLPPGSLRCLRCRPLVAPPGRPAQNSRRSRGEKAGARSERPWCDAAASRPCVQAWAPRHAGSPRSGAAAQPLRQRHDCAPAPACWEGALTCEDLDSADAPL